MSLDARFAEAMGQLLGPGFPSDVGLAVSGGGDSMAMLYLAHNWTRVWGVGLWVITVDHGLRSESAQEAVMVAEECATLGWPHAVARWHWDGHGNKMDAARRARLSLIDAWRGGLAHVLMAHTRDDVAETYVMRLARGAGVEGLSAMAPARLVRPAPVPGEILGVRPPQTATRYGGFHVIRPCLGMRRADLRHYARVLKGRWVEDPSNDDPGYDRVRVRQALPDLAALGLDVDRLADVAHGMGRAKEALRARARQVWQEIGHEGRVAAIATGEILFDRDGFEAVERDTQLRLLAGALCYVAGAEYRPRIAPLEALLETLLGGGGSTLHGCEARMERATLRVFRELRAVAEARMPLAPRDGRVKLWDGRWQVGGPDGSYVRALGEDGLAQLSDRPEGAPPFHAARSLPSLWIDDRLVACPAMGVAGGARLRLWPMGREMFSFTQFLLAH